METDILEKIETEINEELNKHLIVYNDEINSFNQVINVLIQVCNHSTSQAEQCTNIIHHKGKCSVKEGDEDLLLSMRIALIDMGISATVE